MNPEVRYFGDPFLIQGRCLALSVIERWVPETSPVRGGNH